MTIADHPLHRSGRAALPHPAPTSGDDAQAHEGIGMTDAGERKPGSDQGLHPTPRQVIALAATTHYPPPHATDLATEGGNCGAVHRYAVVAHVTENDCPDVLANRRDRLVHSTLEFGFHLPQLRLPPL